MADIVEQILNGLLKSARDQPEAIAMGDGAWCDVRLNAERGLGLIEFKEKLPDTFMGFPVVIDHSIPKDEVHFRHPPTPEHRKGRVDVLKLSDQKNPT
jgi:hypothetical protein